MLRKLCLSVLGVVLTLGLASRASAAPAQIDADYLRAIQTYTPGENQTDQVYLLVHGVAKGKAFSYRYPEAGTLKASPKTPPITSKKPVTLWKGDLADGEFAFVNVALMQGEKLTEAQHKAFTEQVAAVLAPAKGAQKIAGEKAAKAVFEPAHEANQKLVKGIKKLFSRDKGTDHYNGSFNLIVWNEAGEFKKRIDPVGLTFGEDYGIDVKHYSKIKYTRENVLYQDEDTKQWFEYQLGPTSDDETAIRIKMLETELIPVAGQDEPQRNVTDYLMDVKVIAGGEPLTWRLSGEEPGPTILHDYWKHAE
jgi:hypothetical protein